MRVLRSLSLLCFWLGIFNSCSSNQSTTHDSGSILVDAFVETKVQEVQFSIPHGFYIGPQNLTLMTPTTNASIRYTSDGSIPTQTHGTLVEGDQIIEITSTSFIRAMAYRSDLEDSRVKTQTYLFTSDIITQAETPPTGWPADPAPPNNQRMVYGMDPNLVFMNQQSIVDSLKTVPTVSVTTELGNLFSPETGIYVNAREKGRDWEIPVSFEIIDPSGADQGVDINAGFRIRGASTRSGVYAKHNFGFFFRDDYGDGKLRYPLFGDDGVKSFEKIDLRTSMGTDWARFASDEMTMLRELWYRDSQRDMGHPYTRSHYYHLYINGQYWGLYLTQERIGDSYGESYFGGNEDDYDAMKHDYNTHPVTGQWPSKRYLATDGNGDAWESLHPLVVDQTITDEEFATIESQVDLVSLADYYLLHIWAASTDGAPDPGTGGRSNNWFALRNRTGGGPAGKWLFFHHDQAGSLCLRDITDVDSSPPWDLTSGGYLSVDYMAPPWLHQSLLTHPAYVQIFRERVALHVQRIDGALSVAEATKRLDERVAEMEGAIPAHAARWGDAYGTVSARSLVDWQNAIQKVRDCFVARESVVEAQLIEDGLWP